MNNLAAPALPLLDAVDLTVNQAGIYDCPDSWSLPRRTIPDYDVFLVTRGRGALVVDGKKYPARPRDLFLFRPGLPHQGRHFPPDNLRVLALHFSARMYHALDLLEIFPLPVRLRLPAGSPVPGLLKRAIGEYRERLPLWGPAARSAMSLVLVELYRATGPSLPAGAAALVPLSGRMAGVSEYIVRHLAGRLSPADMAQALSMSPSLLRKTVKQATGLSLLNLVNRVKTGAACDLLCNRSLSVSDTALRLGFGDEAYFSRVFKKHAGLSPKQYQLSMARLGM